MRLKGRRWHLAPSAMTAFGPKGPDLDRWIASGAAEVVKSGPHRTVYRVQLPGGAMFVKHCRINGLRAWAREVLRPPKAQLEFENLLTAQQHGIAAAVPLAWGCSESRWPGESFLITRALDNAVPFVEWLAGRNGSAARKLGEFFAKLHDAGIAHPDPHPGNLLVQTMRGALGSADSASRQSFSLIDLHAVRIGRPLSWAASRANLAVFNRWFQLRASRTERLRFWLAYRKARTSLPPADAARLAEEARELERATSTSNRRFWAGRIARCLGANRYFQRISQGRFRGHAVSDLEPELLRELLNDPDAFFASTNLLKDSRTSTVAEIPERGLIVKRVNVRAWWEPIKNLLRPPAVLRSWINGHALRDRLLPSPRPLAAWHRYRFGLPAEGYLLTEKVDAAEPLTPRVAFQVARLLRTMHDRGVSHRDLKASNILLANGREPTFIDLVGVRVGSSVPFRVRCKQLARLNASFLADPAITRPARLRFLQVYLAAGEYRLG
ncbi:MAG TPA: lipopolysaccharide kinase InaA family protein, partial [Urbifossiella sp.]|nr:lipopolysaccharide kinase InaA family protein [Urbifossiella sp.]